MISTKGRYALRVLIDLAEHQQDGYIPMKEVAKRQGISLKYLEQITPIFTRNGLIEGLHGKGGGYRLTKEPEQCHVGEILHLAEGDLAPVACLACNAKSCDRAETCRTLPMWKKYYDMTNAYFDGITVADLVKNVVASDDTF
ncbi:MAG: Rrf2 family transcriptional regulator [Oscillospiraceae bacterium]|nr:Rrf2 family transcriptional regulator [Oscillospiraceae bacterium]